MDVPGIVPAYFSGGELAELEGFQMGVILHQRMDMLRRIFYTYWL